MDNPSLEVNGKTVLILGDFSLESVEDKIVALGHTFQERSPGSQPCDWIKIVKDVKQLNSLGEFLAILMFLSKRTFLIFSPSVYLECWQELLLETKQYSSLIFYENCFDNQILSSNLDDSIVECLGFINNKVRLLNEFYKNNQQSNEVWEKIILKDDYISIEITNNRVHTSFRNKSGIGMQMSDLREDINLPIVLVRRTQDLLLKIEKIRQKIRISSSNTLGARNRIISYVERKVKQIEPLIEQLQRDFVEKQAEQSQRANQLLKIMHESGVEIVPYKERKDISLRVHHFLDEIDMGIFLHLYVPNGRYQEDQLASFLRLFESYLQRVEKLQFFIDTRRTLHGQIYEFKSKNTIINSSEMEVAFSRFESFMSLCQNDQKKAEALLLRTGMNLSEASRLMTKYVKDYQRLLLDIEHERERKMLDLRQRLESDALELTHDTSLAVPQSVQPTELLALPNNLDLISFNISNSSVIINPGVQSYVEQAIYGDIHYGTQDKELFHLFERYAEGLEAIRLRSDLEQLKDTSSSEVERKTAKQKIAGFLSKVAPAIGQSALTVLTVYLEKVLTGK